MDRSHHHGRGEGALTVRRLLLLAFAGCDPSPAVVVSPEPTAAPAPQEEKVPIYCPDWCEAGEDQWVAFGGTFVEDGFFWIPPGWHYTERPALAHSPQKAIEVAFVSRSSDTETPLELGRIADVSLEGFSIYASGRIGHLGHLTRMANEDGSRRAYIVRRPVRETYHIVGVATADPGLEKLALEVLASLVVIRCWEEAEFPFFVCDDSTL